MMDLERNVVCRITYRCRPLRLGEAPEEDTIEGFWTGEVDTWGKYTIRSIHGRPGIYLFRDEIVDVEEL